MKSISTAIERDGYAIVPEVLESHSLRVLETGLEAALQADVRQRDGIYAMRNLLEVPAVRDLCRVPPLRAVIEPILGPRCFCVRGILFDKTPGANWKVPYHQDLSIAVRERRDLEGWAPWSEKAGVTHVQPPPQILEKMLTLRLHLDDCDADNGPLRVLPASHLEGRLSAPQIATARQTIEAIECHVPRGGALLMRPLLLHASSKAKANRPRRVVHLEWAAHDLPNGLEWHHRV